MYGSRKHLLSTGILPPRDVVVLLHTKLRLYWNTLRNGRHPLLPTSQWPTANRQQLEDRLSWNTSAVFCGIRLSIISLIYANIQAVFSKSCHHIICDLLGEKVPKVGWQITELHSSKQNTGSLMKKLILLFSISPLWVPFLVTFVPSLIKI